MDDIEFKKKYMKYKLKYLNLKMLGGMDPGPQTPTTPRTPTRRPPEKPSSIYPLGSHNVFSPFGFSPLDALEKQQKGNYSLQQLYEEDKNGSDVFKSLYELSHFYYRNSRHNLEQTTDLIELLSDMRHDMSSSQRKLRIEEGKYDVYDSKSLLKIYVDKLNNQTKYWKKVNLNDYCCKYTDDESIKIDSSTTSKIGLVENIKKWKYSDSPYLLCGTPITRFITEPFLHTKDTRAADGIIGKNAILSELDGLKIIPDDYPVERDNNNPFIPLLLELNNPTPDIPENSRTKFYEKLMQLYFQKNIEILELKEIYSPHNGNLSNIEITYEQYPIREPYKWWIKFIYYDYNVKIDVTDRGSTQNCYNLNNLNIYFEKETNTKGFIFVPIQDFINHNLDSKYKEDFLCIINILCGLLLKASGDDTQQALSFALSNYVIVREYILKEANIPEKIETTIITHDRQLTRRLLDKLLIIYKQFYNILKEKYSSNERIKGIIDKIENSVTYKTANKNIKKNLLGLCQKVYLDDDNFPNYNYFKFHLENKEDEFTGDKNRINQTIQYYYTLFLYIISINNTAHQKFCKTKLLELNKVLENNIITESLFENDLIKSDIESIINDFKNSNIEEIETWNEIETYFRNIINLFKNSGVNIETIQLIIIQNIKLLIGGEYIDLKKVLINSNLGFSVEQIKLLNNNYTNILYILSENIVDINNNLESNKTKKNKQLLYFKIQTISQDIKIYNNSDITEKTKEWDNLTTWQDILSNIINDTDLNIEYFYNFVKYSYEKIIWKIFTIDDNIIEGDVEIYAKNIITNCIKLHIFIQENGYSELKDFDDYQDASGNNNPTMATTPQRNLIKQLLYIIYLYVSARSAAGE